MRRYVVLLRRAEDGWEAFVPEFPGCVAEGRTRELVLYMVREAISCHLRELEGRGKPIHEPEVIGASVEV
jgi:predicted RNase H-like HicB family nuclease